MSRRRFFAPPEAFSRGEVELSGDEAKHLREVLRLRQGDLVFVFDGEGCEFRCQIEETRRDRARLKVIEAIDAARPESPLDLTLAIAFLKGEKFDLVVQKTTELGVTRIIPLETTLADVRLRDSSDVSKRVARWRRIALEAAKQSGRARIPRVEPPTAFSAALKLEALSRVLFSERDGESFDSAVSNPPAVASALAFVGSEGGWTDDDLAAARAEGFAIVTLGGRTLRAETAAITATALLQHRFGDLR